MDKHPKAASGAFAEYLNTMVNLDTLERMAQNMDTELADSQKVLKEIKIMFDTISSSQGVRDDTSPSGLRHEDLSKFLEENVPKVVMPDMVESNVGVNIDEVIASMKAYAEDLRNNYVLSQPQPRQVSKPMDGLDLEQYASSLDQLSKKLANIKLNNKDEVNHRNPELEAKLTLLCQDVNMFTQMVQAKTTLSECNKNWQGTTHGDQALQYDNIINKLLSGINEVTYLLQSKN